ncbi:MAG: amino acid synthesis family protein [Beijerinckiaceae bacterium]|nr:amino acid synthesis family protein [Beijerinckiaceae bacterium]
MMQIRQIYLFDQEIRSEAGRTPASPTRRVAAAAVFKNPLAGKGAVDDLTELSDLSLEIGGILTARALTALGPLKPRGFGKVALVGTGGDLEHGPCVIHVRLGLAMRRGIQGGPALIPGNAKIGAPGTSIDIIFGGLHDEWDLDAMDTMPIGIPDAPRHDEILLAVAFLAGTRPNARTRGASREAVAKLVADMKPTA